MIEKQSERRGRRHRSRAEADQLAAEYEASGLSREDFCNQKSVALKTLARYVARHRKQSTEKPEPPRWVSVELAGQHGYGSELAVVLAGGRRIEVKRGFDPPTRRQLVSALEQV